MLKSGSDRRGGDFDEGDDELPGAVRARDLIGDGTPPEMMTEAQALAEARLALDKAQSRQRFSQLMTDKRRLAMDARSASGVETRWLDDMNMYHGLDAGARREMFSEALRAGGVLGTTNKSPNPGVRATLFVQIPRQRTNTAAARLGEKMFPSDEENWEFSPTPVPELSEAMQQAGDNQYRDTQPGPTQGQVLNHPSTGQPLTVRDVVEDAQRTIEKRVKLMEKVVKDQLFECGYAREARRAIREAAMLGTGILKGPVIANRVEKKYAKRLTADGKPVHVYAPQRASKPVSKWVSVWNFWPAPGCGDDIHTGSYCFEREEISPQGLRDLARVEGYDTAAIAQCLREGPAAWVPSGTAYASRRNVDGQIDARTHDASTFELWTYTGDISFDDMRLFGIASTDQDARRDGREEGGGLGGDTDNSPYHTGMRNEVSDEDMLSSKSVVVVMCNDRVIKVESNPLDTGELPYDIFNWEEVPGAPWGVGVPFLWRYASKTINAAWRAMLDNAGMAHGPQVVIDRTKIEPADKSWDIRGRKIWYAKAGVEDVSKAFTVFNLPSQQDMMQRIIELGMKFGDEESAVPAIMQGDMGSAPDRVGVVQMLMNAANVVQAAQAKNWDDMITIRHLRRYYDWNMQYHPDESIKGDLEVRPRGATHLIVRDQQKQDLANLMGFSQMPDFDLEVNKARLFRKVAAASSLGDVMNTEEEKQKILTERQKNPPPTAPAVEAANIRAKALVEAAKLSAQGVAEGQKIEAESERLNLELRAQEARANDEREIYKMQLEVQRDTLKYAQENQLKLTDVQAQLAAIVMKAQTDMRSAQVKAAQQVIGTFKKPVVTNPDGSEPAPAPRAEAAA